MRTHVHTCIFTDNAYTAAKEKETSREHTRWITELALEHQARSGSDQRS